MGFSRQESSSQQSNEVWRQQSPFLQQQYQLGQDLVEQQMRNPQLGPGVDVGAMQDFLAPQMQHAVDTLRRFSHANDPTQQLLEARATGANPQLQGVIDSIGADIERNTARQLAGQVGSAGAMGGLGAASGARGQLERGMIREAGMRDFARASQDLRYSDYNRQGAELQALLRSQMGSAQAQLPFFQAQQNLGLLPLQAAAMQMGNRAQAIGLRWQPLQQMAAVLGRPTILGSGSSSSSGFGLSL